MPIQLFYYNSEYALMCSDAPHGTIQKLFDLVSSRKFLLVIKAATQAVTQKVTQEATQYTTQAVTQNVTQTRLKL